MMGHLLYLVLALHLQVIIMDEIQNEIRELLTNFWIVKEESPDLYYEIKRKQNIIKDFVTKTLGSKLIIHDRFIKLEKILVMILVILVLTLLLLKLIMFIFV